MVVSIRITRCLMVGRTRRLSPLTRRCLAHRRHANFNFWRALAAAPCRTSIRAWRRKRAQEYSYRSVGIIPDSVWGGSIVSRVVIGGVRSFQESCSQPCSRA
jgi:hypothetical protein